MHDRLSGWRADCYPACALALTVMNEQLPL
jgi:hypothetical protein